MYFVENLLIEAVYRHARKVILADEMKMNPFKKASLQALLRVRQTVTGYAEDYFAFFLVLSIMEKKSRMIITASTKGELQEIVKPSVPSWNYGNFLTGPYHVLEEEAILWSEASLEAPLNDDGVRRYQEVFSKLYPEQAAEIWK